MRRPFVLGFLFLLSSLVVASPTPGLYELYDGTGRRTGTVTSTTQPSTYNEKPSTQLVIKTEIKLPQVSGDYVFAEIDTAELQSGTVVTFKRETDDNGKKSIISGERRSNGLFIFATREGKKFTTMVPLSSFDITEFEMDLPASKFTALKKGETTALRVFMVEELKPVQVSRNISDELTVPFQGKNTRVLVTTTAMNGKATTSWFHAKTHELLQEEGDNHLMSRASEVDYSKP